MSVEHGLINVKCLQCLHFQKKSSQVNHGLQSYLKTSDGRLVAHLVREFLAFFDLRHTLRDSDRDLDSNSCIFPQKDESEVEIMKYLFVSNCMHASSFREIVVPHSACSTPKLWRALAVSQSETGLHLSTVSALGRPPARGRRFSQRFCGYQRCGGSDRALLFLPQGTFFNDASL